jgi:predicted metal-dependent enzyme (double-stranded beta helix superfamily)
MTDPVAQLAARIRPLVDAGLGADETALAIGDELRAAPPSGDELLTAEQRLGSADGYCQHLLHVEPGGVFSLLGLVWRPGQDTPIHDHRTWCVVAVLAGTEQETIYELRDEYLVAADKHECRAGSVSVCTPPGDIHSVRNAGAETALSLHVYGADISALGTSIRRRYDMPVR